MRSASTRNPIHFAFAIVIGLVGIVVASTGFEAWRSYRNTFASAEREATNVQSALVEHTARTFEAVTMALDAVAELQGDQLHRPKADSEIFDLLKAIHGRSPVIGAIGLTDAAGNRLHSSLLLNPPPLNIADQEAFKFHEQTSHPGIHIAAPIRSKVNGEWIIPVSRRLDDHDGRFTGIAQAIVRLRYFVDFYRTINLGREKSVLLWRDDGTPLVREPEAEGWSDIFQSSEQFRERLRQQAAGTFHVIDPNGVGRLVSYGKVPGLPLVVGAAVSEVEILAPFYDAQLAQAMQAALMIVSLVVGGGLLVRLLQEQRVSTAAVTEKTMLLEATFASISKAIGVFDRDLRLVAWNEKCLEYFGQKMLRKGISLEELLSNLANSGEYGSEGHRAIADRLAYAKEGKPQHYQRQRPDGTILDVHWRKLPNGFLVITHSDISDIQRTELALRESEERLRSITTNLPSIVYRRVRHPDGRIQYTYINQHLQRYFGVTPEQAIADPSLIFQAVHEDDRAALVASMHESATKLVPWQREFRVVREDGAQYWMRGQAQPRAEADGTVVWDGVVFDVTERRLIENALRESEARASLAHARMSDAIECLVDGFLLWDKDDRLVLLNNAAKVAHAHYGDPTGAWMEPGVTFSEIMERRVRAGLVPEARGREEEYVRTRIARHRNPDGVPVEVQFADGHWVSIREQRTHEGGVVSIRTDITEMKRREAELAESNREVERRVEELELAQATLETYAEGQVILVERLAEAKSLAEAATDAKSSFLAAMSHEIRTPMNGVMGMIGMLLDTPLDDQQRHWATVARDSAESLLTIINDILDFSKIEAGKFEMEQVAFSPAALVASVEALLAPKGKAKGLDFSVVLSPRVPGWVMADPTRWRQVLVNLVGNAIKFTGSGSIGIAIDWSRDSESTGRLWAHVTDTGIGLPPDAAGRLFGKFVQADQSISRRFGGTGLGLAISRDLVERMGGKIGVESEEGRGSRFWYWIAATVAAAPEQASAPGAPVTPAKPLRILVAEDNRVNQMVIQAMLARGGHAVDLVFDGVEAVEAVLRKAYDVVLMDMQMPEMDGLTATRRIRALDPPARDVPIVALTANVSEADRAETLAAGMVEHVAKPIDPVRLFQAIARATGIAANVKTPGAAPASAAPPPPDAEALDALDAFVTSLAPPAAQSVN